MRTTSRRSHRSSKVGHVLFIGDRCQCRSTTLVSDSRSQLITRPDARVSMPRKARERVNRAWRQPASTRALWATSTSAGGTTRSRSPAASDGAVAVGLRGEGEALDRQGPHACSIQGVESMAELASKNAAPRRRSVCLPSSTRTPGPPAARVGPSGAPRRASHGAGVRWPGTRPGCHVLGGLPPESDPRTSGGAVRLAAPRCCGVWRRRHDGVVVDQHPVSHEVEHLAAGQLVASPGGGGGPNSATTAGVMLVEVRRADRPGPCRG